MRRATLLFLTGHTPTAPRKLFLWVLAAHTLTTGGHALAQPSDGNGDDPVPYYIGASQAFSHDSNVFRVPTDVQGDSYSSTGVLGGIDQPFSSQRFYAFGKAQYNRFDRLSMLNNTSYGLNTGLDWVTLGSLSGTVSANLNRSLANYGATNQLVLMKKNTQTTNQFLAQVDWGKNSYLPVELSAVRQQLRYSAPEYASYETNQTVVSAVLKYSPSGLSTVGAGIRRTSGEYPQLLTSDGDTFRYNRTDLDLLATWFATGQTTIDGRLSFGRQHYEGVGEQDFSGNTGLIHWAYKPTDWISLNAQLSRDTGQNTTFLNLDSGTMQTRLSGDNSQLTTAFTFSASDALTAKINLNANVRLTRRSLVNAEAVAVGQAATTVSGSDRISSFQLGATYAPTLGSLIACSLGRERRSISDGTPLYLSYPYSANTATCSVQLTLQ